MSQALKSWSWNVDATKQLGAKNKKACSAMLCYALLKIITEGEELRSLLG